MKRILGLDLGTNSIGWAIILYDEETQKIEILDIGCRIVPVESGVISAFTKGQSITVNADRTKNRTTRKTFDRYQIRKSKLKATFDALNMTIDEDLMNLSQEKLWELRAKAVHQKVELKELARVLYHINQKRGYNAMRVDEAIDEDKNSKERSAMVKEINNRYFNLKKNNETIGEYVYLNIKEDWTFRYRDIVFPRRAYKEEYDAIMECQKTFYPDVLTDKNIKMIRNNIMFYQRDLRSCKHLVSNCEFESRTYNVNGEKVIAGPKVAAKSSPLSEICRLWETINNLSLTNSLNEKYEIPLEKKNDLFEYLMNNETLKKTDLFKKMGLKSKEWNLPENIKTGIKGNTTLHKIRKALDGKYQNLLVCNLSMDDYQMVNQETGEVKLLKEISCNVQDEPLYRLWHTLYSLRTEQELRNTLVNRFGITDEDVLVRLNKIDFVKSGYGNKSVKFMRKLLPYLMQGMVYSDACEMIGVNHSNSVTKEEIEARPLKNHIELLKKGALRQPIVEKILNQMINVVNALLEKYSFDEIHVELARELQQSKEERNKITKKNSAQEKDNKRIAEILEKQYHLTPSKSKIVKYKLWEESGYKCIYCGEMVSAADFLNGDEVEVEHIIPKALLFNDSYSNKACSCRKCNQEKKNQTAFDYMSTKGNKLFSGYVDRVNELFAGKKISHSKFSNLMMKGEDIPSDFIERQLRLSQYISKKALEILSQVCRNVLATGGSITSYLRHLWGWDKVLEKLNMDRYRLSELTEIKEINHNGNVYKEEHIKGWNKRIDHRHHAIDALTVACTSVRMIQLLNNLNTLKTEELQGSENLKNKYNQKRSKLDKYVLLAPHCTTKQVMDAASAILISTKPNGRVATVGKRYIYRGGKKILAQSGIISPRGSLCEGSVYGRIKVWNIKKQQYEFKNVIKYKVGVGQGCLFGGNEKNDSKNGIDSQIEKVLKSIVDCKIREIVRNRLREHNYILKYAFVEPLCIMNKDKKQIIKSVRCFTANEDSTVPVKKDENGNVIGLAMTGNNHHIAIYKDSKGNYQEQVCTFWNAVERKKYGVPVVITKPRDVWDKLLSENIDVSESFMQQLPKQDWTFEFSMVKGEMFILGMGEDEYNDAIASKNKIELCKYLYKVQNISNKTYRFILHTQTQFDMGHLNKSDKLFYNIQSINRLIELNPHKVQIDKLGNIII